MIGANFEVIGAEGYLSFEPLEVIMPFVSIIRREPKGQKSNVP